MIGKPKYNFQQMAVKHEIKKCDEFGDGGS